jgi:hypothetical protein
MAGFPALVSRKDFGPTLEDEQPVKNPKTDIGADQFNLLFWQVGGMNLMTPRAIIRVDSTGNLVQKRLAFDPNVELPDTVVTVTKGVTGAYTVTFQAQYNDQQGNPTDFIPQFAMASREGPSAAVFVAAAAVNGQDVEVFITTTSGAANDEGFILFVW